MSRGWNTEADPASLPKGSHPVFTNLTLRTGAATPRSADATYLPPAGSAAEWRLAQLGVNSVTELYDGDEQAPRSVAIPVESGDALICSVSDGVTESLTIAAPAGEPILDRPVGVITSGLFIGVGESASYAMTWVSGMGHETGLSPVAKVQNDYLSIFITNLTGSLGSVGDVITNTSTGATAVIREVQLQSSYYLVSDADKSDPATWTATQAVSWSNGSGTLEYNEAPAVIQPRFSAPQERPASVNGWNLYRLEEQTGYWRCLNEASSPTAVDEARTDDTYFPFHDADQTRGLPFYPGPLDENALPETLVEEIAQASTSVWHKGCLFIAEGDQVRYSEPTRPRQFRTWARLNAGSTVLAMKSRAGVIEVFTTTSVREIRGDSPYFEIWELGVHEGPVAQGSIVATDLGTFALFDDGVYLYTGGRIRSLTAGTHTSWVRGLADPASALAGASHGVYYLVADGGECLAYDWEADEWFHRTFTAKPDGFHYVEEVRALVAKVGENHLALEQSDAPVEWAIEYSRGGDGRLKRVPGRVLADAEGAINLELIGDGERVCRFPLTEVPGSVRLPPARARSWALRLDGTGTKNDTAIRELSHD
jgi:hypothetical protein